MSIKRWIVSAITIGLFGQSLVWARGYKVETLYEREFEMEIQDVVLGEYQEEDVLKFYPKIVCLTRQESRYDSVRGVQYFVGPREIRILNYYGEVIKKISFKIGDKFGYSRRGNYFYVFSKELTEGRDEKERVFIGTFAVYSDNGTLMYEVDDLVEEYETGYALYLSSKDGSALIKKTTNPYTGLSYIELYDKSGKKRKCEFVEREKYNKKIDIADNGKYIVSLAEYPEKLPSENKLPTIIFLDSLGNVLWERTLKEKKLSGEGGFNYISANGSYVYASGYDLGEWVVRNGYIFNEKGELVMEILGGCEPLCFSADEDYLLIRRAKKYRLGISKDEGSKIYGIALIDIADKQILFEKEHQITGIPAWNGSGTISNDRKVSFINVDVGADKGLGNRMLAMNCCVTVLDREGNHLWNSEPFYSDYAKVIGDNVRWHNSNLIYIWIDETRRTLQVKSVRFTSE